MQQSDPYLSEGGTGTLGILVNIGSGNSPSGLSAAKDAALMTESVQISNYRLMKSRVRKSLMWSIVTSAVNLPATRLAATCCA